MSHNPIQDIPSLQTQHLESLDISFTQINSFDFLAECSIDSLNITSVPADDFFYLIKNPNIKQITLNKTQVRIEILTRLQKLKNIKTNSIQSLLE